jgi:cytidylate kinase
VSEADDASDGIARITAAVRRAAPRAGRTRVVAIDGRSGSGKTSLAAALRDQLQAPIVSLEDLYGGWDGLERGIDLLVASVLEPLTARRAASFESLLVWLEVPALVRKRRALDRDGEMFAPHWDQWAAQEDLMLTRERTPDRADITL